jgi:hypothetical protein
MNVAKISRNKEIAMKRFTHNGRGSAPLPASTNEVSFLYLCLVVLKM